MTIATEIRVVEFKYDNISKECTNLKIELEKCEANYEENYKNLTMEFNTKKKNYENMIENLQMELETVKKELEILRVIICQKKF